MRRGGRHPAPPLGGLREAGRRGAAAAAAARRRPDRRDAAAGQRRHRDGRAQRPRQWRAAADGAGAPRPPAAPALAGLQHAPLHVTGVPEGCTIRLSSLGCKLCAATAAGLLILDMMRWRRGTQADPTRAARPAVLQRPARPAWGSARARTPWRAARRAAAAGAEARARAGAGPGRGPECQPADQIPVPLLRQDGARRHGAAAVAADRVPLDGGRHRQQVPQVALRGAQGGQVAQLRVGGGLPGVGCLALRVVCCFKKRKRSVSGVVGVHSVQLRCRPFCCGFIGGAVPASGGAGRLRCAPSAEPLLSGLLLGLAAVVPPVAPWAGCLYMLLSVHFSAKNLFLSMAIKFPLIISLTTWFPVGFHLRTLGRDCAM
jgi:hypothetical protein